MSFWEIPFFRFALSSLLLSFLLALPLGLADGRLGLFIIVVCAGAIVCFMMLVAFAALSLKGRGPGITWVPKGEFSLRENLGSTVALLRSGRAVEEHPEQFALPLVIVYGAVSSAAVVAVWVGSSPWVLAGLVVGAGLGWMLHRLGLARWR